MLLALAAEETRSAASAKINRLDSYDEHMEKVDGQVWLDYSHAAKRVKKSERTIQLWRREGMPMEWADGDDGQRYRVVEEQALLAWWRQKMQNSPVHQYRLRRAAVERGEAHYEIKKPERNVPGTDQAQAVGFVSTALQRSQVPERQAQPETLPDPIAALLASLPEFRGQAEHAALVRAMEHEPPGCDGLETFTRDHFTDPEETEMMRSICRECPLLVLCEAFALAGGPTAGMWAGMTPAEVRRLDAHSDLARAS